MSGLTAPPFGAERTSLAGELARGPASGWINTVPLSSSTNTLSKRSTRSKQVVPGVTGLVKDYIRKRNLILDLLVSIPVPWNESLASLILNKIKF
jgi:hypothetical protein